MNGPLLSAIAALALSSLPASRAHAAEVACPASIKVAETLDPPPPESWSAQYDHAPRYLAGVTFFDGDPKENRSIVPTRDTPTAGKRRLAVWRFGSSAVPVWLGCRYLNTGVLLARRLPDSVRACRVSYAAGGVVERIDCQ
ncbi:MAG: hypothetical protein KGL18_08520 [Burkholderiales bacterium]|nr:hypothetical protein [Burkholderiales bacterium]MDE1926696.1 hypothetical protein [Burkholderiales bacterium]MDE2157549.1 hypothetical protein [Burkholderiales bacterium]MDE2503003.1 hypothetical protein [Burkholderiales bacterium]